MVTTRSGTPTWIAASPMPGASYMVSNMSATRVRMSSPIFSTGFETVRNLLSGRMMMSRSAMKSRCKGSAGCGQCAERAMSVTYGTGTG